ncbi:XRE family transcriptional regulator [Streptomyces sp. NBC_00663]|uniref:sigma factor-like helix-turn-helix DNA-binding protein n=1 Tax=Streptomyces sp. NBC_00663 TaxID=2975801 RepID=UPI002E353DEE|nr:sigma factor-like helix-turn-helix DNA-binding protein [Streptomyces sp. NBC_00663]
MTTPPVPQWPADPPHRRGRPPEPICKEASTAHRTWLEPVRTRFAASGLTLDELVGRSGFSKTRLSELMRGKGLYPTWEITYSVVRALDIPVGPLRRLWRIAAVEADKKPSWITDRLQAVPSADPDVQPVAHMALYQAMAEPYSAYAQAFLQSLPRARQAIAEVFDILWLTWDEATSSPDMPRHAWQQLRATVLARAARRPAGHYDLRAAAFLTVHQAQAPNLIERLARIDVLARFFDAIAQLPDDQMDVTVLRYLCGLDPDAIAAVVGLPPALVHTLDHHARWALKQLFPDIDPQE